MPTALLEKLRNAQDELREKHVLDFDASAVTAITLAAPNQSELVLQRLDTKGNQSATASHEGVWQIVRRGDAAQGPQTLPADRAAVQRLLEQLSALSATKFLTESAAATDLENWGFNRPEREISLTLDGPPTTTQAVQIGLATQRDRLAYARLGPASSPGASIYVVDPEILRETRLEPYVWRERLLRELPPAARFTALKLTDLTGGQVLFDSNFDAEGNPSAPLRDAAAVEKVRAHLRTLRAKNFVQDGFSEKVLFAGEERPWRYELTATVSLPGGATGDQSTTTTLLLTERGGGAQQLAGLERVQRRLRAGTAVRRRAVGAHLRAARSRSACPDASHGSQKIISRQTACGKNFTLTGGWASGSPARSKRLLPASHVAPVDFSPTRVPLPRHRRGFVCGVDRLARTHRPARLPNLHCHDQPARSSRLAAALDRTATGPLRDRGKIRRDLARSDGKHLFFGRQPGAPVVQRTGVNREGHLCAARSVGAG